MWSPRRSCRGHSRNPCCIQLSKVIIGARDPERAIARPQLVIGIGGPSGVGKSTLAASIAHRYGQHRVAIVHMDGYHRYTRDERLLIRVVPEDPLANYIDVCASDIIALRAGRLTYVRTWDHAVGAPGPRVATAPREIILVDGLHPGRMNTACRIVLDKLIYMDTTKELRHEWRIGRDSRLRSYPPHVAEEETAAREDAYRRFIRPQATAADVVVRVAGTLDRRSYRFLRASKAAAAGHELPTRDQQLSIQAVTEVLGRLWRL